MALPIVGPKRISDIKSTILSPALTSHFAVSFNLPSKVNDFITNNRIKGFSATEMSNLSILCADASLPGSSLFTHEVTNDYTGVTEKMVYRRQYDDTASFTFYVDREYKIIQIFESWINYIVGEDNTARALNSNFNYRVKYKDDYAGSIIISKFERDIGNPINTQDQQVKLSNTRLDYTFVRAFPIAIDSMPVSYEGGTVMKCNVNFSYMRYVAQKTT